MMELLQRRTHSLINLLKASVVESNQVEYGHELDELHQHFLETARTMLSEVNPSVSQLDDQHIQGMHSLVFPFPLRAQSSDHDCAQCNLCERLERRIAGCNFITSLHKEKSLLTV